MSGRLGYNKSSLPVSPVKLLREPLLHFLLAGALLFAAYAWLNPDRSDEGGAERTIRITERELTWLAETWTRQWQRPPSERELLGLVTDYLREELLAREARTLEFDRDDVVIRRRLAQKMSFVLEDTARLPTPTDDELRALYAEDPARFDAPAEISFVTVFFSPDKRGERAAIDARAALVRLSAGGDAADQPGDSSMLPGELREADEETIAGVYGVGFAAAIMKLAPGQWHGPIESAFGLHLVRVTDRREAVPQPFEAVRALLAEEWRRRSEQAAMNAYFKGLLQRYEIEATDNVRPLIEPAIATLRGDAK